MVRFSYTPAFEDWRALNLHVLVRQFRVLLIVAGVVLFCFVTLPLAHRLAGRDMGLWAAYKSGVGALWLPGIVGFVFGATYYGVHQRWKKAGELRQAREFVFDETGLSVTAESFSGRLEWQHMKEADVARGLVLLKSAQNQFYFFPRRLVPDWPAFQALVGRKVRATRRFTAER